MSKYRPLSERLSQEAAEEWRPSFAEIEDILGFPLPKAAQQGAWWRGGEKPHHRAWLQNGWEVCGLDTEKGGVHFRRAPKPPPQHDPVQPAVMKQASEAASKRIHVQRAVGGAAIIGGAMAMLAGIGVLGARLLGKKRA